MEKNNSDKVKIHIFFPYVDGPYGGGNQFLKALRDIWIDKGIYANDIKDADIVLINSIQAFEDYRNICRIRRQNPEKLFVHRIDGPIFLIRDENKYIDYGIGIINKYLCDASVFQTEWNRKRCEENGIQDSKPSTTICNGSDRKIFHEDKSKSLFGHDKINVIATSWSSNWNKGFEYYQYLDQNIDRNRFQFIFVGNSPIRFKNAIQLPAAESDKLAEYLQSSDIYVTASKKDPCSNSLIEALNCGLPAAVYKDGGHPYILNNSGECFETKEEMLLAIDKISKKWYEYRNRIPSYDIYEIASEYYKFVSTQYREQRYLLEKRTILRGSMMFDIKVRMANVMIFMCVLWGRMEKYSMRIKAYVRN